MGKFMLGAALLLLISAPIVWGSFQSAGDGVVLTAEMIDERDAEADLALLEIKVLGDLIRFDVPAFGNRTGDISIIFRGDRDELTVIEHDKESYIYLNKEMIRGLVTQFSGLMQQLQGFGEMPEGTGEQLDELLAELNRMDEEGSPPPVSDNASAFLATGDQAEFGGYSCELYEQMNARERNQLCLTDAGELNGGDEVRAAVTEFLDFTRSVIAPLQDFGAALDENLAAEWAYPLEDFRYFLADGLFPVGFQTFFGDDERPSNITRVRSSDRQTLEPTLFEAPEGYRAENPLLRGLGL